MKYIIVDPEDQSRTNLKYILDSCEMLAFREALPPMKLLLIVIVAGQRILPLSEWERLLKVLFISSRKEDAVEAFEYGADGFGHIPFAENKKHAT
ncbi:hypothetical protein [Paenibacillus sp. sgz500958]|uniref:hypothetical protein n=1 Tax=Paenibacillus sp. sgz500958 TaxID=3242475 RepID=UPI0036D3E1E6